MSAHKTKQNYISSLFAKKGGARALIAPSILSADFAYLANDVARVQEGGASLVHIDVMDGRFVPNITIGPLVVESLRKSTSLPLDVHLMIENPERYISDFANAGASMLSIHPEATRHLQRALALIRSAGASPGVALNPATSLSAIENVFDDIDFVLLMSVNPGFGGQNFIPASLKKAKALSEILRKRKPRIFIEMDGGISESNIKTVVKAGVSVVVAGSAVFHSADPKAAVGRLVRAVGGS